MAASVYDVVVVGAGSAGLSAGMFAARRGLATTIITKDLGGQLALTEWIENYPGVAGLSGRALAEQFRDQGKRDGAEFQFGMVVGIEPMTDHGETIYRVRTAEGSRVATRTVILAFGLTPNDLGVPGEDEFRGKGVYYSAVLDAPPQDGKRVAVVGGGNSAVTAALALAPHAETVALVHRRPELRAERSLLDRLAEHANIKILTPYTVAEIRGNPRVRELALTHVETSATRSIPVDSVFVQIGYSANTKWLDGVVERNARGEIVIDRDCRTSAPGIFAAGDVTDITYKQAVISAGEGVKAALQAFKYLATQRGKPAVMFDWDTAEKKGD